MNLGRTTAKHDPAWLDIIDVHTEELKHGSVRRLTPFGPKQLLEARVCFLSSWVECSH